MTDPIEGEIVDRSIATIPQPTGVHALAELTDAEFERNLAAIAKGQERIKRMQTALLVAGVDYGNIPGVDKPSLGKPGAEKFTLAYNTTAEITRQLVVGDNVTTPLIGYDARCEMHLGSFDGPVIGVGFGTCNSWEAKYRYRNADRVCPKCGKPTIIKGKTEYGGGWLCFAKKGGCGEKYADNAKAITDQQVGQIENPDPWDLANTIMKMAEKRAHTDAVLRTFAASGIFTQDMEDNVGTVIDVSPAAPAPAAPAAQPRRAASTPTAPNEPPEISDAELDSLTGVTVQSQAAERVAEHRAARVAEQAAIAQAVPTAVVPRPDPHAMTFGEGHPCKLHAKPLVQDAKGGWGCAECRPPR